MTTQPDHDVFASARAVADAVLYEGYLLYPYRASSAKNRTRWQFGVLMPPTYCEIDSSERSAAHTEVVFEAPSGAVLRVLVRFLHLEHREGGAVSDWDEAVEREVSFDVSVDALRRTSHTVPFRFNGSEVLEAGVSRRIHTLDGELRVGATELPGPYGAVRLHVSVANLTRDDSSDRDAALRSAMVSAHSLYALDRGRFLSMVDPPEWAAPEVAACVNEGTWPVLAGSERLLLSSPIILGDNPEIAPESPGDLFDATEIDEILTLRTMTLTDDEKAQARATDPRAAALIDRVDELPPEQLDRLHGALRYLRHVTGEAADSDDDVPTFGTQPAAGSRTPWWDPGTDASVSPESDVVLIDGVPVSRGSRVRLRPGVRSTDAQDLFLQGRTATVEAVFFDVDGQVHVGVTPDDDSELAELQRLQGRFLYFAPDEIETVLEHRVEP